MPPLQWCLAHGMHWQHSPLVWSFCILQSFLHMREFMLLILQYTIGTCITRSKYILVIILYIIGKPKWKWQCLEILLGDSCIYSACLCTCCQNSCKICIWECIPVYPTLDIQALQNVSPLMFLLQLKVGRIFKALWDVSKSISIHTIHLLTCLLSSVYQVVITPIRQREL